VKTALLDINILRKGVLATFHRGLRTLAGEEFSRSVEIVPTR
jgi:hypothetical protein